MKKSICLLLLFASIGCNADLPYDNEATISEVNIGSEDCKTKQEVVLKSLDNNIIFTETACFEHGKSEPITEYQLKNKNSTFTFDKKHNEGNNPPHNEAISLYQSKNHGLTLLSITGWDFCCFPRAEGVFYEIDIYQLNKSNDGYQVSKIPSDEIGFENHGFEGDTFNIDSKSHFKLKTIYAIKDKLKILDF